MSSRSLLLQLEYNILSLMLQLYPGMEYMNTMTKRHKTNQSSHTSTGHNFHTHTINRPVHYVYHGDQQFCPLVRCVSPAYPRIPGSRPRGSVCRGRNGIWACRWEPCGAGHVFPLGWHGPAQLSLSPRPTSVGNKNIIANLFCLPYL